MRRRLMFLSHCLPWPPDKGEKIRAWHVLRHLARDFDIHLGCVTGGQADPSALRDICAEVAIFPIHRRSQAFGAFLRARPGRPLMPDFYAAPGLRRWAEATLAGKSIEVIYIYTVAMAPYVDSARDIPRILDAVDIDSEKWRQYAAKTAWPMRLVWAREGRNLLKYERRQAAKAAMTLFVSHAEAARFTALAPETASHVQVVENGIDLEHFSPAHDFATPFPADAITLVFTGHMDYWPNADAVIWFAREVMPLILADYGQVRFWIVGANPGAAVRSLARNPAIRVTGRVADTRPYIAHAAACVCPLRFARGIQNKVLEAMAMGRPVIASAAAFQGIRAGPGKELLIADSAATYVMALRNILNGTYPGIGRAARAAMDATYAWDAVLKPLDSIMARATASDPQ